MAIINSNEILFGVVISIDEENEEDIPYEPTETSDYVWLVPNEVVNVIYYLGDVNNPEIPIFSNNATSTKLLTTSFDHSDVERVKIPEGVVEIE